MIDFHGLEINFTVYKHPISGITIKRGLRTSYTSLKYFEKDLDVMYNELKNDIRNENYHKKEKASQEDQL